MDEELLRARREGNKARELRLMLAQLPPQKIKYSPAIYARVSLLGADVLLQIDLPEAEISISAKLEFNLKAIREDPEWKDQYNLRKIRVKAMDSSWNYSQLMTKQERRIFSSIRRATRMDMRHKAQYRLFALNKYEIKDFRVMFLAKAKNRHERRLYSRLRGPFVYYEEKSAVAAD